MSDRILTQRELNRALLARQLLLERVDLPIPTVLEQICGIQNQYAPNAYIRLWSTIASSTSEARSCSTSRTDCCRRADTPAPVRFLPTWDAVLLVHARRTGILDEDYRKIIFSVKVPPSFPTFLVDGRVAGTWKYADGRVVLDPFEPLDKATRRALDDEAERLAAFHA